MGVTNMEIILNQADGCYHSYSTESSLVTGRVLIEVDSKMEVRDIVLNFKGKASVVWINRHEKINGNKKIVTYRNKREYFSENLILLEGTRSRTVMKAGIHRFPFNTVLRPNLPSSYEGLYGCVRYRLQVVVEKPVRFNNTCKKMITVISPLHLSRYPGSMIPVTRNINYRYSDLFGNKSLPISLELSLPTTGYVPSDTMPVTVNVTNRSDVAVNIIANLQMVSTFQAEYRTKKDKKICTTTIKSYNFGLVLKRKTKSWTKPLKIASVLSVYNLTNCSFIDVEYQLTVLAVASGLHHTVEVSVPLTIGTVPFTRTESILPVPEPPPEYHAPPPYKPDPLLDLPPSYSDIFS